MGMASKEGSKGPKRAAQEKPDGKSTRRTPPRTGRRATRRPASPKANGDQVRRESARASTPKSRSTGPARKSATRGRPAGVRLTPEITEQIAAYIRRGIFPHVAAEGQGVPPRTFREWIARGEGRHPTRASTPETEALAEAVRKAKAEARMLAE